VLTVPEPKYHFGLISFTMQAVDHLDRQNESQGREDPNCDSKIVGGGGNYVQSNFEHTQQTAGGTV